MKLEDIKARTAALRGGEYKQCDEVLHDYEGCKNSFCCLGVAIDVLLDGDWIRSKKDGMWKFDNKEIFPSHKTLEKLGLNPSTASYFANKNDNGYSFHSIADWIEEHTDRLLHEDGRGE